MANEYERVSDGTAATDHLYTRKRDTKRERRLQMREAFKAVVANLGDVIHEQDPEWAAELFAVFIDHATGGVVDDTPETVAVKARVARSILHRLAEATEFRRS